MRDPQKKPATYEDLKALPENMVGQILEGELIAMPRPALPHAQVTSNAGGDINARFGRSGPPGGWWILDEPEVHLSSDVLVPDLGGWRRERLPVVPAAAFLTLPPDWVLEVLSPSTASIDRIVKARIYAREGVRWMWLIDPAARTIEAHRLQDGGWFRTGAWGAGEKIRSEPLLVEFSQQGAFQTVSCRLPFVLGPENYEDRESFAFSRLIAGAPILLTNGGNAIHSFVYAGDVAQALIALLQADDKVDRQAFNIAIAQATTSRGFIEACARLPGKSRCCAPYRWATWALTSRISTSRT